jgi:hypothetical protein
VAVLEEEEEEEEEPDDSLSRRRLFAWLTVGLELASCGRRYCCALAEEEDGSHIRPESLSSGTAALLSVPRAAWATVETAIQQKRTSGQE